MLHNCTWWGTKEGGRVKKLCRSSKKLTRPRCVEMSVTLAKSVGGEIAKKFKGRDNALKFRRCQQQNTNMKTNIRAVFDCSWKNSFQGFFLSFGISYACFQKDHLLCMLKERRDAKLFTFGTQSLPQISLGRRCCNKMIHAQLHSKVTSRRLFGHNVVEKCLFLLLSVFASLSCILHLLSVSFHQNVTNPGSLKAGT